MFAMEHFGHLLSPVAIFLAEEGKRWGDFIRVSGSSPNGRASNRCLCNQEPPNGTGKEAKYGTDVEGYQCYT